MIPVNLPNNNNFVNFSFIFAKINYGNYGNNIHNT